MNTDFTKIDKSNFECIKMNDPAGGLYYGQLKWAHCETNELKDNLDEFVYQTGSS